MLHRPLAEGLFADQAGAAVILQRAGDDLRAAGRRRVHQDRQRPVEGQAAACGVVGLLLAVLTLLVQHHATGQELAGHVHRSEQRAAGIVAQVEDQPGRPLLPQVAQGILQLVGGALADEANGHVAGLRFLFQQAVFDGGQLDRLPFDLELQQFLHLGPADGQLDSAAHGAPDQRHHVILGHAHGVLTVHGDDDVALLDAGQRRRRVLHRREHDVAFLVLAHPGADAAEVTPQLVPLQLPGLRLHENGVGVLEAGYHAVCSAIGPLHIGGLIAQEFAVQEVPRFPERAEALGLCLAGLGAGAADEPVGAETGQIRAAEQGDGQQKS